MSTNAGPSPTVQRLVAFLAEGTGPDGARDPTLAELGDWLAASTRFRVFVEGNRDKIRKKLRGATSADARLDVRAELLVARLLLEDRRFELTFEAYGARNRGPDFTVTYRAGRAFNVEVTRRRTTGDAAPALEPAILGKLRQLPPSASNVLVVVLAGDAPPPDPAPVLHDIRARADRRDDEGFRTHGLADAAAVHAGLLRLAAVVAISEAATGGIRERTWPNAGARIPLPDATLRAFVAALGLEPPRT